MVVAAWLVEAKQSVIENIAPVLTKVFTPLTVVMLIAVAAAFIASPDVLDVDRSLLLVMDLILVLVVGLVLYALSARDRSEPPGLFDALQLSTCLSVQFLPLFSYPEQARKLNKEGPMDDLLAALVERLEEFGLQVDVWEQPAGIGHDVGLVLSRGSARQEFAMELKPHATLSDLGYGTGTGRNVLPLLIGAASVSPRSADAFRRAGIQYVDVAGNAWIRFGEVLIDVRGKRPPTDRVPDRPSVERTGHNLFSTGRAQVAFVLIQWPRSWTKPQRDVAEAAGVSLGQAHNALTMFRKAGFGPGGHRSDSELLDLWVASFPTGLARKLVLATYRGSIEDFRKVNAEDPVFTGGAVVSGEVAAPDLLRPAALTIYVAELDPMLPVKNRWRSDGDANITVRRKFWKTPPDEPHDYDGPLVGLRNAPNVLVYADLMASDDPRVRDAATEWRERIARLERHF